MCGNICVNPADTSLIIQESGEMARWVTEGGFHVPGRGTPLNPALGGLPRGGDAGTEGRTTNRHLPGEEGGNMFEHLIEGKKKRVFRKRSQGTSIFPGCGAE